MSCYCAPPGRSAANRVYGYPLPRFAPELFLCANPSNFMDLLSVTEMRICDTLFN